MDGRTLTRLRLAFIGLGVALLLPLALLVRSAAARLEEQRKLKHQVVAERIFDEMERELALLLEHERARPSSAYATTQTRVASWDPFVVGYFTRDAAGANVIASAQLTAERNGVVRAAAERAWSDAPHPASAPAPAGAGAAAAAAAAEQDALLDQMLGAEHAASPAKDQAAAVERKQEAVLRQLNRSAAKKKAAVKGRDLQLNPYGNRDDDPLGGMDL